ncbi:MAG: phenylalanine--tRNA ligase subunit alpha [Candidatus Gracilibacteria bacterium]|nr:phenylalanine--tRNA ligase subunit alpha [Candidatus Gracilibacteria bacterium]
MQQKLTKLQEEVLMKIGDLKTEQEVIDYRNDITGKNGSLTEILKGIKDLSIEEKQTIGKLSNDIKTVILNAFEKRLNEIKQYLIQEKLKNEFFDVTIPGKADFGVHSHPLTSVLRQIEDTFKRMGFDIYESNEVTTEYFNFDSLNVPATHPARDMQDTFWLEGIGNVLSTQTSSMQNIIMKSQNPPIRAIIPGRVFRNEDIDATHENTFYQVEGIVIDEGITLGNLKYTIRTMLSDLFESEVTIRLRPGYFPFVEPGVEVDFSCPFCKGTGDNCRICKHTGWIEFMGAGLIHPNVLKEGGIDPEKYSGFAFGFGMNRLAMIKYSIPDMRYFQHPNVAFLKQF